MKIIAKNNSYSPYSNYPVAAMVTMVDGRNFYGVNIENALRKE